MSTKSTDTEELLQLAREDVLRNRLSSAEKYLAQAILLNNQIPDAFYLMGMVYSKRGKLKKAILAFQKALTLDPCHTDAAIALSSLYNDMGKYSEGALIYQRAKKRLDRVLPGHDPRINRELSKKHAELGDSYLQYERFEEAHDEYEKAGLLDAQQVQYTVKRALCLSKLGSKTQAAELLSGLVQTHPDCVEARIQLGVLYHSLKKLTDAHREWQEALALNPDHKKAQMYLSMIEAPTVN